MNVHRITLGFIAVSAAMVAGCSSTPKQNDQLETARAAVQQVESAPDAGLFAADEVTAAHEALRAADQLVADRKPQTEIQHMAYLAKRHAEVAAEQIERGRAEKQTAEGENQRQQVLLQAREREADAARAAAERTAAQAEQASAQAERERALLQEQLKELQAKQTDRGLVLTLGDVLFDTGQAALKPGAMSTISRLAQFLNQSPDRSVTIEGHTDSVGADSYNMMLSENRANSVKAALIGDGVPAERIVAVGKGEAVPVAGNDSAAGRQQNRRVEIIVSNPPAVAGS